MLDPKATVHPSSFPPSGKTIFAFDNLGTGNTVTVESKHIAEMNEEQLEHMNDDDDPNNFY
jgi:hypothetical protein